MLNGTGGGAGDDDSGEASPLFAVGAALISARLGGGGGGFLRACASKDVDVELLEGVGGFVAGEFGPGGRGIRLFALAENLRSSTKVLIRDVTPPNVFLPKSILSA